jgi:hypothetical protein
MVVICSGRGQVARGSVGGRRLSGLRGQRAVGLGTAVAEKLPDFSYFLNHVEVEVGGEYFVLVTAGLGKNLAARVAEVALAIKFADVPGFFRSHAIDRAHKIAVGSGMRGLLQFPQIFRQPRHRG